MGMSVTLGLAKVEMGLLKLYGRVVLALPFCETAEELTCLGTYRPCLLLVVSAMLLT
jgi:hypothetical protein